MKSYRRSYDSDFSANMVHHYVWPCLILFSRPVQTTFEQDSINYLSNSMNNNLLASVLSKGEACTRNPLDAASQQDRAAALLNNEYNLLNCPHPFDNATTLQSKARKRKPCSALFFAKK